MRVRGHYIWKLHNGSWQWVWILEDWIEHVGYSPKGRELN